MIQITPQMRILVAVEAVDFRKGIDGLARVCQEQLDGDPFSGCLFVFRNRSGTGVKILVYDGRGFWRIFPQPEDAIRLQVSVFVKKIDDAAKTVAAYAACLMGFCLRVGFLRMAWEDAGRSLA